MDEVFILTVADVGRVKRLMQLTNVNGELKRNARMNGASDMAKYNRLTHLKHPDKESIYAFVCGQPISPYGYSATNNFNEVTCSRCKTRQLLAWRKEMKKQKNKRTSDKKIMKELILKCGTGAK